MGLQLKPYAYYLGQLASDLLALHEGNKFQSQFATLSFFKKVTCIIVTLARPLFLEVWNFIAPTRGLVWLLAIPHQAKYFQNSSYFPGAQRPQSFIEVSISLTLSANTKMPGNFVDNACGPFF